eukprot:10655264-Alexandrium_andersonii.AAC.1
MADCGLGRIAEQAGLGQRADCTLGALRCKDPSMSCRSVVVQSGLLHPSATLYIHMDANLLVALSP